MFRLIKVICAAFWLTGLCAGIGRAETFQLTDGAALTGDVISFNESGLIAREGDGKYSDRVPWTKFSQEDLKRLAQNPKIAPLVAPFIEVVPVERSQKTEVQIKAVSRLERPPEQSLTGAFFSSGLGVLVLLLLYAGNLYAAYEISIYRTRPAGLVCGVSALLPLGGPILFLALPAPQQRPAGNAEQEESTLAPAPTFSVPGQTAVVPETPSAVSASGGGLRLAESKVASGTGALPQTQVFQRGAFTFNRRFFETKFSGFLGVVAGEADKDMVLLIKAARGQHLGRRITRISAGELHLLVEKGPASEEILIPFTEIQEIHLKHKDA